MGNHSSAGAGGGGGGGGQTSAKRIGVSERFVRGAPAFAIASEREIVKKRYGCWDDGRAVFNTELLPTLFVRVVASFYPKIPPHSRTVAVGMSHSLVLDVQRKLYAFGSDAVGQIGGTAVAVDKSSRRKKSSPDHEPVKNIAATATLTGIWPVPFFERVRVRVSSVFAGREHTIVLDSGGRAYAFGKGSSGQLGVGDQSCRSLPCYIDTLKEPIVSAALGDEHSIFLAVSGTLYGCGCSSMGQSGQGVYAIYFEKADTSRTGMAKERYCLRPQRIAAGAWSTRSGGDFARKEDSTSNVASSSSSSTALSAHVRDSLPSMGYVAAGPHHTLAISHESGDVYAWGSSFFGQLGLDVESHVGVVTRVPFRLEGEKKKDEEKTRLVGETFEMVAAGYSHSLALSVKGRVYAWGTGSSGQLGLGSDNLRSPRPQLVSLPESARVAVYIAAGYVSSFVLTKGGDVYEFGTTLRNVSVSHPLPTRVKLAIRRQISEEGEEGKDDDTAYDRKDGDGVVAIVAGGHHALLLSSQGTLYAYGKGCSGEIGAALSGSACAFERPKELRTVGIL